jgi:hypothetical protein
MIVEYKATDNTLRIRTKDTLKSFYVDSPVNPVEWHFLLQGMSVMASLLGVSFDVMEEISE